MLEKRVVAFTEIVKSRFAGSRPDKTILGTLSIACKQELALPALLRERRLFHRAKRLLFLTVHHLDQ